MYIFISSFYLNASQKVTYKLNISNFGDRSISNLMESKKNINELTKKIKDLE
jgi:hypothetical protein